jgi:multidrug efflux pump subunit AcrA (membrane-fusion protein)
VLALLAGVLYYGHHSGWKVPRFSALRGAASEPEPHVEWCQEHSVPESICVECQPNLYPKGKQYGWCKVHGVMECPTCHPELYQGKGEPRLPQYDTVSALALLPRAENNSKSTLHQTRIQFVSAQSAAKAGIDIALVEEAPMTDVIEAHGEITFDPTHVAHLSSRVPGTVFRVLAGLGQEVQAGQVLAVVDAAAVGQAKAHLLSCVSSLQLAQKNYARLDALRDGISKKQLQEAEAAVQSAEIECLGAQQALVNLGFELPEGIERRDPRELADELRFLGLPTDLAASLARETRTANLIPITAPLSGQVVETEVVAGEVIDAQKALFTVADPRQMWLMLHVAQEHSAFVRPGMNVEFTTDDESAGGRATIDWISPAIDAETRMLHIRARLDNRHGTFRDTTFAHARVIVRQEPHAVIVPKEAVQSSAEGQFVFVRDKHWFDERAPKLFHVRQVRIGATSDTHVELLAGALPGEVVASQGSAALLAQLLRGQLGDGCGHHHH